mmetsp:Transcript_98477/g.260173  ORF Transcript_98477/g.260173 Transcript_98477/m.260173 type:complete len:254 (-) Transcript_98477:499-1260(-)
MGSRPGARRPGPRPQRVGQRADAEHRLGHHSERDGRWPRAHTLSGQLHPPHSDGLGGADHPSAAWRPRHVLLQSQRRPGGEEPEAGQRHRAAGLAGGRARRVRRQRGAERPKDVGRFAHARLGVERRDRERGGRVLRGGRRWTPQRQHGLGHRGDQLHRRTRRGAVPGHRAADGAPGLDRAPAQVVRRRSGAGSFQDRHFGQEQRDGRGHSSGHHVAGGRALLRRRDTAVCLQGVDHDAGPQLERRGARARRG